MVTRQIVRRVVVPLVLAVLAFAVPLALLNAQDARLEVVELAERQAATVALLLGESGNRSDPAAALGRLPHLEGEVITVLDPAGRHLTGGELAPDVRTSPVVAAAFDGRVAGAFDGSLGLVVAAAPMVDDGEVLGAAVVTVPGATIAARTRRPVLIIGVVSVVLIAGAVLGGRRLARSIVHPVEELDRVAARLASGDLDARAAVTGAPPELQRLADTLNHSASELQRLLALQRSFVADASHQLRTPLSGLRLQLENAQLAAGVDDHRLETAIGEVDRLAGLVGDLLALARAEGAGPRPVAVDVPRCVAERAAAWTPVAEGADVAVHVDGPSSAWASCVPGGLEQVLDNLIANALRVAPDGTAIDVDVSFEDRAVVCRVLDRGPGLPEEQRHHAFERFWRAPTSAADGGSGLGLPIAAETVRASGGTIELHERPEGGLIAEVRLPRAEAPDPQSASA